MHCVDTIRSLIAATLYLYSVGTVYILEEEEKCKGKPKQKVRIL